MANAQRVIIENRKTGEQYAVTPAAHRSHYEPQGFAVLRWETGEPYVEGKRAPAPDTGGSLVANADEKRLARNARAKARRHARKRRATSAPAEPEATGEE